MALYNITVGPEWGTIVEDGEEFFISLPFENTTRIELAPVTAGGSVADGLMGHALRSAGLQEMNRQLIGPGEIKARCRDGNVTVVASTWT